jgi:hypothetical protein
VRTLLDFYSSSFFSLPFWQGIGGPLVGGLIGGLFAVLAQLLSNGAQRRRDRKTERQAVTATLEAMEAELEAFQKGVLDELSGIFKDWDQKWLSQVPINLPPVNQNYFTVFESNAATIGRIKDPQLRQNMVNVYSTAKGLVDAVSYNTQKYWIWERLRCAPNASETKEATDDLIRWASSIRAQVGKLQTVIPELLSRIEDYTHGKRRSREVQYWTR